MDVKRSKFPPSNKKIEYFLNIENDVSEYDWKKLLEENRSIITQILLIIKFYEENQTLIKNKYEIKSIILDSIKIYEKIKTELQNKRNNCDNEIDEYRNNLKKEANYIPEARSLVNSHSMKSLLPTTMETRPHKRMKKSCIAPEESKVNYDQQTIWSQVNKFLGVFPRYPKFQRFFDETKPVEPIPIQGPHFTLAYNEKFRNMFRNENCILKVPGKSVIYNYSDLVSEGLSKRILCAFVNIKNDLTIKRLAEIPAVSKSFFPDEDKLHPLSDGTSPYTRLPFSHKLFIEVHSIDLTPTEADLSVQNEILLEIEKLISEFNVQMSKTNDIKKHVLSKFRQKEEFILQRFPRQQIEPLRKLKRSKSRGK